MQSLGRIRSTKNLDVSLSGGPEPTSIAKSQTNTNERASGLPRVIAGSQHDTFGALRPGHEWSTYQQSAAEDGHPAADFQAISAHRTTQSRQRSPMGRVLTMALLVAGLFVVFNLPPVAKSQLRKHADTLAINAGLGVDHVAIIGHNRTRMKDIAAALELNEDKSLIGFSAADVRRRLRRLPWIESTRVTHILPTTVSVESFWDDDRHTRATGT